MARQWRKGTHNQCGLCTVTEATDGASTCRQMPHTTHTLQTLCSWPAWWIDQTDQTWKDWDLSVYLSACHLCLFPTLFKNTTNHILGFRKGCIFIQSLPWRSQKKKYVYTSMLVWNAFCYWSLFETLVPLKQDQTKPCLLWSDVCYVKKMIKFFV